MSYDYRRPGINSTLHVVATDYTASKINAINTKKNINIGPNEISEQELHSFHCSSNVKAMNAGSR
jgi:hypothetical protein